MAQLFLPRHYKAFAPGKELLNTPVIYQERLAVVDQFMWLHNQLKPHLKTRTEADGWDIHPHHQKQHIVSSWHHVWIDTSLSKRQRENKFAIEPDLEGTWKPIVREIGSMWLGYGKSKDQLNEAKMLIDNDLDPDYKIHADYANASYVHCRIQFYINHSTFRAWLVYTSKSVIDRGYFIRSIHDDASFRTKYWEAVQPLIDQGFFYEAENSTLDFDSTLTKKDLFRFITKEVANKRAYSGIIREYTPDDPRLSTGNIAIEMTQNLDLLYPVYDLMVTRHIPGAQAAQPRNTPPDLTKLFGGVARNKNAQKKSKGGSK